jgi:hypothetical protein
MVSGVYAHCTNCCKDCPNGGRILIVTDSGYGGTIPNADGYLEVRTDEPMADFLEGIGYCVDTTGFGGAYRSWDFSPGPLMDAVNAADLIIFTKYGASHKFGKGDWNAVEVPLLLLNGHLARGTGHPTLPTSGKWGWTNASNSKQAKDLSMTFPGAPSLLDEITIFCSDGFNEVQNPFGDWPTDQGAEIVGMYDGRPMLVDIPAGTDFDEHCDVDPLFRPLYGVAGERRVYLGADAYDKHYDWNTYISCQYEALFATIVADMIPEPAMIALLVLGGVSLLRRRR